MLTIESEVAHELLWRSEAADISNCRDEADRNGDIEVLSAGVTQHNHYGTGGCSPTTTVRVRTREKTPADTSIGIDFTRFSVCES